MPATESMLGRHVAESLRRARWRLIAIVLVCAASFGIVCGSYSGIASLLATAQDIQQRAGMAEFEILASAEDIKNVPDFSSVEGVRATHRRLLMTGQASVAPSKTVAALMISAPFEQHRQVNRLTLLDGQVPDDTDTHAVMLERNCAHHYRKAVGDTLTMWLNRQALALRVSGIVLSPEYLIAPLNPSAYVPASGSLCVLYGSDRLLRDALGFDAFNSILVEASPTVGPDFKARLAAAAATRLSVDAVSARSEQFSLRFLELDLKLFEVFVPTVVMIFSIVSTLTVFFLTEQWIRRERPLIAMFLTLGYPVNAIVRAYMRPAVIIALGAVVLGVPLAWLDMWALGINYANSIGMPAPDLGLRPGHLAASALLSAATVTLGIALPIRRLTRVTPLEVLKRSNLSALQWPGLEALMARISVGIGASYALRSLLRNWATSVLTVAAVAATLAVTVSFRVSNTSMMRMAFNSLHNDRWVAVADFDAPLWVDEIQRLQRTIDGSEWSPFIKGVAHMGTADRRENVNLLGLVAGSGVRRIVILEGRDLVAGEQDVALVERRLATTQGLRLGDRFELRAKGRARSLRLVGVHASAMPGEIVVPLQTAGRVLDLDGQMSGAFLVRPPPSDPDLAAIAHVAGVSGVALKAQVFHAIMNISQHVLNIINTASVISIFVVLLFLATAANVMIASRAGEYATLRVLGYSDSVIKRIVLVEVTLVALLGALLSMPLGAFIGHLLNDQLSEVWFKVFTDPSAWDFLSVALPAIVFMPLASAPIARKLLALPLHQAVSERGPA